MIACEDTRVTRKLCNHYEIETPLKSYHEHNKEQQTEYLIEQLISGLNSFSFRCGVTAYK